MEQSENPRREGQDIVEKENTSIDLKTPEQQESKSRYAIPLLLVFGIIALLMLVTGLVMYSKISWEGTNNSQETEAAVSEETQTSSVTPPSISKAAQDQKDSVHIYPDNIDAWTQHDIKTYEGQLFSIKLPPTWTVVSSDTHSETDANCVDYAELVKVSLIPGVEVSAGQGGFEIVGFSEKSCPFRYEQLTNANFQPIVTSELGGFTTYHLVEKINPGVPTIRTYVVDIAQGPVTHLMFSYNAYPMIELVSEFDGTYDSSCIDMTHPLMGYFCKEGNVVMQEELEKTLALYDQILEGFLFEQ